MARTYLLHAGKLNWQKINPDIFGSMIQAVADDEERGALGMHYTSVPNILKVLNPLFLDGLRAQLEAAGDNKAKLLNLRKRMARIRVFDPACGSGNFLVIAYKQMREIEAEINRCRGEANNKSEIPLTNFRGIELRDFPAEIARLALIIAEFQCDVLYRGQQDALAEFLPLNAQNWIVCGNALRLDWLSICPPTGTGVKVLADDLFGTPLNQTEIDFVNEGGETYICGNPPYLGSKRQTEEQKSDLEAVFGHLTPNWRSLDYVAGWFLKASDFRSQASSSAGFVATNSICQGQQASILWPLVFGVGYEINFAHTSFNWRNLASHNAGVTVVIVGIALCKTGVKKLYHSDAQENSVLREVPTINAYLIPGSNIIIEATRKQIAGLPEFERGNSPTDGGHLLLDRADLKEMGLNESQAKQFIRPFIGSLELIRGASRFCIWIEDEDVDNAMSINSVADRVAKVRSFRLLSTKLATRKAANWAYRFDERKPLPSVPSICVPVTSSENRAYLPADLLPAEVAISNLAFGMPCAEIWVLSIVVSRMMLSWVSAVCARMRTDYRFTNTLCWNTFPAPLLTEQNKADLTRSAEDILLAREAHFPATIADLYDPESMPDNLRHAHERNDEVLERIYIGRRFRNDTERLEKLFDLYTKMTADTAKATPKKPRGKMA
nr:DNA methyltransferase [Pseudomonas veronii]